MQSKPVVLVPAYNEEAYILRLLKDLKKVQAEGGIGHVMVVDDGSKDRTSELAKRFMDANKMEGSVIRLEQNHGKGMAMYQGIKHYYSLLGKAADATKMIMLDADIWEVTKQKLDALAAPLGKETKRKTGRGNETNHKVEMVIGNPIFSFNNSGQRAFSLKSLKPFLVRHSLGREMMTSGYGIEPLLNDFYGRSPDVDSMEMPRIETVHVTFKSAPASSDPERKGRTAHDSDRLLGEFLHGHLPRTFRAMMANEITHYPKSERKSNLARLKQERKPNFFSANKREFMQPTVRRIR